LITLRVAQEQVSGLNFQRASQSSLKTSSEKKVI
jgi:hypothetical protein